MLGVLEEENMGLPTELLQFLFDATFLNLTMMGYRIHSGVGKVFCIYLYNFSFGFSIVRIIAEWLSVASCGKQLYVD